MLIISTLIHAPAILIRIGFNAASLAAVISTIAAVIAVGVTVTKVVNTGQRCCDPFHEQTVVLQTQSSFVFDRPIQSYEYDYYYNATTTLYILAEEINEHVQKKAWQYFY
ncbi:unnamed protein product [Rotaria sp. Silwood1]|nr:unnamed protein product [Rotaria sp. Silwood1]CAF3455988.1 unnamed protein product [Rotaria sp. Silwood1]CAF3473141.1 unnamed protein product [Rotaria sp. Silwood1]CAF4621861.1 unnamed protein product [Rotaria sp. Silwood1]CAF4839708.1 unnamed protein product [Rotaria sp. Silwood1]